MSDGYRIVEGVSGMWHYHVVDGARATPAICGARTMHSNIKWADWGKPFGAHFPKKPTWCATCARMAALPLPQPCAEKEDK